MARYCVNKGSDHEVHKVAVCNHLPLEANRINFNADSDIEAMRKARTYYWNADGCKYCMPAYHKR